MTPEEFLKLGKLDEALAALQDRVRANPSDAKLRTFLFQLLSVMGQWDRASKQLDAAEQLDSKTIFLARFGKLAILCEQLRADVFAGEKLPMVLGEPAEWVSWMIQANQYTAKGNHAAASQLRAKAMDAAPTVSGTIAVAERTAEGEKKVEHPFEWIADADQRLGPILEVLVEGKYYWAPFDRIALISIDKPSDLRDTVWTSATIRWTSGGETGAFIPTRYPGSEAHADPAIRMARSTLFEDLGGEDDIVCVGRGQRILATDAGDYGIMDVRTIRLNSTLDLTGGDSASSSPAKE
jgi:type VI secretion system protein ImpE